MGRLLSFLGGAAKSLANTIDQDRAEKQRAEDDDKRFKMNLSYAKAANAINIMQEQASKPADQRASGAPFLTAPGGYQQNTEIATPVEFDENYDVKKAAGWAPGPSVAVPDPNALDPYKAAMLEQKQLDRESREKAARIRASGGGSGGAKVRTVTNSDGSKTDYDPNTGDELKHYPAKGGGGKGGMTEKGWREGMDSTLSSIQGAEDGKLKSIIRQYGGDNILTGDMDTEMLRDTAFSVAETYWNERKPSNSPTALSAPPAAVAELKADPSPEAKRDFDEVFGSGAADLALGRR